MKAREVILRLVGREYLPMLGNILGWVVITAAVGHADAVRLLTAMLLVRTARAFTMLDTGAALKRRLGAPQPIERKSFRRAVRIELISLAAAALLIAVMVAVLWIVHQRELAIFTALVATGLPARHFGPAAGGRRHGAAFRSGVGWSGLILSLIALPFGLTSAWFALILGIRDWIALAVSLAPRLRVPHDPAAVPIETPLTWREVAAITGTRGRHRLTYRVGKGILTVFGPFGNIAARTARGMGAHRRIVPTSAGQVAAVTVGALAGAVILPVILAKPATMLASASLLRIAAAAGNVLLWWPFAVNLPDVYGEDDEDDD